MPSFRIIFWSKNIVINSSTEIFKERNLFFTKSLKPSPTKQPKKLGSKSSHFHIFALTAINLFYF